MGWDTRLEAYQPSLPLVVSQPPELEWELKWEAAAALLTPPEAEQW